VCVAWVLFQWRPSKARRVGTGAILIFSSFSWSPPTSTGLKDSRLTDKISVPSEGLSRIPDCGRGWDFLVRRYHYMIGEFDRAYHRSSGVDRDFLKAR
jgi:hypothetical protein